MRHPTTRRLLTTSAPRAAPDAKPPLPINKSSFVAFRRAKIDQLGLVRQPKKLPATYPQTELFRMLQSLSAITRRPTLINEDSARQLVRAWGIDKMHDVTVIDAYAGEYIITSHPIPSLLPSESGLCGS